MISQHMSNIPLHNASQSDPSLPPLANTTVPHSVSFLGTQLTNYAEFLQLFPSAVTPGVPPLREVALERHSEQRATWTVARTEPGRMPVDLVDAVVVCGAIPAAGWASFLEALCGAGVAPDSVTAMPIGKDRIAWAVAAAPRVAVALRDALLASRERQYAVVDLSLIDKVENPSPWYRNSPYSNTVAQEVIQRSPFTTLWYADAAPPRARPAANASHDAAVILVGNVPWGMKTALLMDLLARAIGVEVLSLREDPTFASGGRRVLFRMKVRPEHRAAVLALHDRVLCLKGHAVVLGASIEHKALAQAVRDRLKMPHGPLRLFEAAREPAPHDMYYLHG